MAKINLGMSGGVDSAVAAYILNRDGYEVQGINMLLCPDSDVCGTQATACRDISNKLDIVLKLVDLREEFRKEIMDDFVREYENGRTPNPCCLCNRLIKFKYLDDGSSMIATGHYARIAKLANGRYAIRKAENLDKDQSYFLYGLSQDILARTVFPLAELSKDEVRRIADEQQFSNAHQKDSQDICFIPGGDYATFILEYKPTAVGTTPGSFVDTDGNVLGEHKGLLHYTIGQRKGLGISLGKPAYVYAIDTARNEVVLADDEEVFCSELCAGNFNWMSVDGLSNGEVLACKARIRYRHHEAPCTVTADGDKVCIVFDEPQRAITPGQSVVLYDDDIVIGGGIILTY